MSSSNTSSENNIMTACANCGKGEEASIDLKSCAACVLVKYCSRECQAAHRPQHKKECKKRAAELREEKLFKQPPPLEDCPICMIRIPSKTTGSVYMNCCGKLICRGCVHAFQSRAIQAARRKDDVCPFCRTPPPKSDEEYIKRYKQRSELYDEQAISSLGHFYAKGQYGFPQNSARGIELWQRAAELGSAEANYNIGLAYHFGDGVEVDVKKARHHYELSAIEGYLESRYNLGCLEGNSGNMDRAVKHFMIGVKAGDSNSLKNIKLLYSEGHATKDDYAKALRSYQSYLDDIKSGQRDEAAAFHDDFKYY